MDTSTTASRGSRQERDTCDYGDWEDLKELFAKASEKYESDDVCEALPLVRGVIHECHRFVLCFDDPSVLFTKPHAMPPLDSLPRGGSNLHFPTATTMPQSTVQDRISILPTNENRCACGELPTAFHAIFGAALFLFGNLIAQEPSLALDGEPNDPVPYWLAALDVFETGENLPSRTSGRHVDLPEDWRMAIVWGRTLTCIAEEMVTRERKAKQAAAPAASESTAPQSQFSLADDPTWPADSPFAAIAMRRPPLTSRMLLSSATPNELMRLAMDQFSRGIFRMPHARQQSLSSFPQGISSSAASSSNDEQAVSSYPSQPQIHQESFSRAKELFTIASEVLLLAEKLEIPSERKYWASWADSVFNQMKMAADLDAWRGPINRVRGRCRLIVGSAYIDDLENALERGEMGVLESEEAQEARAALTQAVTFFELARGSATATTSDPELREVDPMLAEALLTLGNLTTDSEKQKELYARAQQLDDRLDLMDDDSHMVGEDQKMADG